MQSGNQDAMDPYRPQNAPQAMVSGPGTGATATALLAGFAWCEVFATLGLHVFWMLSQSPFISADNASGVLYAVMPFAALLGMSILACSRHIQGVLLRLEPLFHGMACWCFVLLLGHVTWHDPFEPVLPLGAPLYLWSIGVSFALVGNLAAHVRGRSRNDLLLSSSSILPTIALTAAWWGGSLCLGSGAPWPVYFWTASLVLHTGLALMAVREPFPARFRIGSRRESVSRFLEGFFLLLLLLVAQLSITYSQPAMGRFEPKYLLYVGAYSIPFLSIGIMLFLFAAWRGWTLASHIVVAALITWPGSNQPWAIALALGYGLTALFAVTRRQGAFLYSVSAAIMAFIWLLSMSGFAFSGMVIHFQFGLDILLAFLKWGQIGLWFFLAIRVGMAILRHYRGRSEVAVETEHQRNVPGAVLCIVVLILVAAVAAGPGGWLLVKTSWPPQLITRPVCQTVQEPMGLCHAGYSQTDDEYRILDELGAQAMRVDFTWSGIQPSATQWAFEEKDGYVDTALRHGKQVIALLDFDNDTIEQDPVGKQRGMYIAPGDVPLFLEYVRQTVSRYKGRVYAWEIWNEPDIERFWAGPMEEFYGLARQTAETVRQTDPEARIVGTAMTSPFGVWIPGGIDGMHISSALAQAQHPSGHLYVTDPRNYYLEFMKLIGAARRFKHPGSVWVTELGAPDGGYYPWGSETELLATHLMKAYVVATSIGIEKVVWYCFRDSSAEDQARSPRDAERFFGLLGPGDVWKPSAYAYRLFGRYCTKSTIRTDLVHVSGGLAARQLRTALYRRENGETALILWFEPALRPWGTARVQVNFGAVKSTPTIHDIGSDYSKPLLDDHILVSDKPVFITFQADTPEETLHVAAITSPVDFFWLLAMVGCGLAPLVVWIRSKVFLPSSS